MIMLRINVIKDDGDFDGGNDEDDFQLQYISTWNNLQCCTKEMLQVFYSFCVLFGHVKRRDENRIRRIVVGLKVVGQRRLGVR